MRPPQPAAAVTPRPAVSLALLAGLALLLGFLTLAHPSATRIHTWPWSLGAAVYWVALVAQAAVVLSSSARPGWPNRLVPIGLALLATATIASALASPFPAASLPRIWPALGGTALFFLLWRWIAADPAGSNRSTSIARAASVGGALLIVVSLLGWWGFRGPLPFGTRNTVPFGHSNYTAGAIVLALPWCGWAAWTSRSARRLGWIAVFAAGLIVLASTSSRGGALAAGLTAAATGVVFLWRAKWPAARKAALAVVLLGAAAAAILSNQRLRDLVLARGWSDAARESNRQRSAMFAAGIELGRQRPLLGWGPGTVPLAYPAVRAQLDGGVDNVVQLHNTPVQIWATLGLAGIIALLLLCVGTAHAAVGQLRAPAHRPEAIAAAASLGGYAVFALTDHQFDLPIINAFAAANLALLTACHRDDQRDALPRRRPGLMAAIGIVGIVLLAIPLTRDLRARCAYEAALVAWENRDIAAALAELDRAAQIAPADSFYQHQAAGLLLQQRDAERDGTRRKQLTQAAAERLEASLNAGVHQEFAHFNLGWLELDRDRPARAARHFAAAARLVPDKGGVYFGLGLALLAGGDEQHAVRAFALEWVNAPSAINSPAWELPHLAALRPAVHAETLRIYAELIKEYAPAAAAQAWTRWWLGEPYEAAALARGFSVEARDFAAALPMLAAGTAIDNGSTWNRIYGAWREPDAAARFHAVAVGDAVFAAALQQHARRHRRSFHAFLTAPTGDESALVRTYRRQRTGYGVLALHPDGPALHDLYVVQENRVAAFFADVLPPKGWLPGRYLLARLPQVFAPQKPKVSRPENEPSPATGIRGI